MSTLEDSELENEFKASFLDDSLALLADAEKAFLDLETHPDDMNIIDKIFRVAHCFKGGGHAVGFNKLGEFAHAMESLLLRIKKKDIEVSQELISLLLKCNDQLTAWVVALRKDFDANVENAELYNLIQKFLGSTSQTTAHSQGQPQVHSQAQSQIPVEIPVQVEAQAQLSAPSASPAENPAAPPQSSGKAVAPKVGGPKSISKTTHVSQVSNSSARVAHGPSSWNYIRNSKQTGKGGTQANGLVPGSPTGIDGGGDSASESLRVSRKRVDSLLNYVGELVIFQTVMTQHKSQIPSPLLRKTVGQLAKITKDIQSLSMSLRMIPLRGTFQKMQRIVRDTSRVLKKEVLFETSGEDTELDKSVVDALGDPLMHLMRNAVDHGIENAEERVKAGKPANGTIFLASFQRGSKIVIEIRDDGKGLNPEILKKKALEKGLIRPGQQLTDQEAQCLIFHAGFSTKAEVTEVSGRGVGMDVVKTNIEALQGEVEIDSTVGEGTCFRILLPLTLAIIDGMVVRLGNERYVIPISHVHESTQPVQSQIHAVTGMQSILSLRGESLPLFHLSDVLKRNVPVRSPWECTALIVRIGQKPYALQIDSIACQQQVVIKQLGLEVRNTPGLAGSAILGDGTVSMILELTELVKIKNMQHDSTATTVSLREAA